jgi:opacity protein-like surface antigen
MINGFYDYQNQTTITPYLGAGLGFAYIDLSPIVYDGSRFGGGDDIVFAYQFEE